ncbi:MAG: hypothetical protein ISR84_01655 [Kiritimatiellales bacterium]|nr:hypothetical protein [Kiritimatiellales bacterium]
MGPCVAKRTEALQNPDVDYVLTFEELGAMMIAGKVDVLECEPANLHRSGNAGAL